MNRLKTFRLAAEQDWQILDMNAAAAGGSFTITVAGIGTTAPITTYIGGAGATAIQNAIRALGGAVAATTVTATGGFDIKTSAVVGDMSIGTSSLLNAAGAAVVPVFTRYLSFSSATTVITSIAADMSQFGDKLTLISTAASQQLTDGSNLKLVGNWVTAAAGETLTLVCDGTNWIELSRTAP